MLRLAMVGCGQVAERFHLPAMAAVPGIALTCVVETSAERREAMLSRLRGTILHESVDEALGTGAADAALVATPPATHAELAGRCLAAGWHVLVEKPMAGTVADARRVVEAGGRAERRVAVGFNRRFRGSWRAAAALDREDAALAGLLEDVVPHQVDLLAFLFRDPIRRLRADELRFQRGRSIELLFTVEMGGGVTVGCRAAHGPWHAELLEAGIRDRRLVANPHGARWAGRAEGLRRRLADLGAKATHAGQRVTGQPTATSASFTAQLAAFALAVRDGQAGDLADGAAGLAAAAAGEALQASVRTGGGTWAAVEGREVG